MTARRLARHWVVAPVGTIGVADSTLSSLSEELTYLEKQSLTVLPPQTILGVSAEGVRASFGTFWITVSDPTRPLELVLSGGPWRGEVPRLEQQDSPDSAGRRHPRAPTLMTER
jgi:hypothetical protein